MTVSTSARGGAELGLAFFAVTALLFQPAGGAHEGERIARHNVSLCRRRTRYSARPCSTTAPCPELAARATPRTTTSLPNATTCVRWFAAQAANARAARLFGAARSTDDRPALMMVGDSITEELAGTKMGWPAARSDGVPEALARILGHDFATLALGISGDQTQHLLWRLRHGEMSRALATGPSAPASIVSVLIGTNNLAYGHSPTDVLDGIRAVADEVLAQSARALLAINALLPRADGRKQARPSSSWFCPLRCGLAGAAPRPLSLLVDEVNAGLPALVDALRAAHPRRTVRLVDCAKVLLDPAADGRADAHGFAPVLEALVPDLLHPNAAGFERILACQRRAFAALMLTREQLQASN